MWRKMHNVDNLNAARKSMEIKCTAKKKDEKNFNGRPFHVARTAEDKYVTTNAYGKIRKAKESREKSLKIGRDGCG